jgi:hypothetical protein
MGTGEARGSEVDIQAMSNLKQKKGDLIYSLLYERGLFIYKAHKLNRSSLGNQYALTFPPAIPPGFHILLSIHI